MKFSIILSLLFLTTPTVADGIRRSFEIMTLWYTYQARIEELLATDGNLNRLDIIPIQYGDDPHSTLTFNRFVEYVTKTNQPRTPANIVPAATLAPDISGIAYTMFRHRAHWDWDIPDRWDLFMTGGPYSDFRIMTGVRTYSRLILNMGQMIWDMSQRGHLANDNMNIARARQALEMVRINRQIDYDRFWVPAVTTAPEFTGRDRVNWVFGTPITQRGEPGSTQIIWMQKTLNENGVRPNLAQDIRNWQQNTYFTDPDQGQIRQTHWHSYELARQASEIATTGRCT